jgi:hypothetical protein
MTEHVHRVWDVPKARQGLNRLLEQYPEADVVEIIHQSLLAEVKKVAKLLHHVRPYSYFHIPDEGPWTSITLMDKGEALDFAIWNRTGNVYNIDKDGAVEDDPFIWITSFTDTDSTP